MLARTPMAKRQMPARKAIELIRLVCRAVCRSAMHLTVAKIGCLGEAWERAVKINYIATNLRRFVRSCTVFQALAHAANRAISLNQRVGGSIPSRRTKALARRRFGSGRRTDIRRAGTSTGTNSIIPHRQTAARRPMLGCTTPAPPRSRRWLPGDRGRRPESSTLANVRAGRRSCERSRRCHRAGWPRVLR
jgi:hypothetical protein